MDNMKNMDNMDNMNNMDNMDNMEISNIKINFFPPFKDFQSKKVVFYKNNIILFNTIN